MDILSIISSVLPFMLVVGPVIIIHELGHYWAARAFGGAVKSFAIGFGNSAAEICDKNGTKWKINWLPLGGYVSFIRTPEEAETYRTEKGVKPVGKPYSEFAPWQRSIVAVAGPMINFAFSIALFTMLFLPGEVPIVQSVQVREVIEGSVAEAAGLRKGDEFVSVDGKKVKNPQDVSMAAMYGADDELVFEISRDGSILEIPVIPQRKIHYDEELGLEEEIGFIGVGLIAHVSEYRRLSPIEAFQAGIDHTFNIVSHTIRVLKRLITGKEDFSRLRGPIGIGDIADKIVDKHMKQEGASTMTRLSGAALDIVRLAAFISVSVGFLNLLPLPMLDGQQVLTGLYETVSQRTVSDQFQTYLQFTGLAMMAFFFIAVTLNDLKRKGAFEAIERLVS